MSDINKWLSGLGLSQYAENFAANDIDMDILDQLSETDLVALHISLGHRKKILKAIGVLTGNTAQTSELSTNINPERRYMTLMFCDLVDSTELATVFDIEEMHDINRAYQTVCTDATKKFGGYIARYMGDGVLVYFGYPVMREDDAERALWAGLEIIRMVNQLNKVFTLPEGLTLSVRIGIATGHVVVETIGEGANAENAVVGEAPNLAARLQKIATPNAIVVGPDTHRLVTNTFEFSELGEQHIKGYIKPLCLWQVRQERPIEQYFRRKSNKHLTPLIDRENELSLLISCWQQAYRNEGQVVLLSGEAGIGKTRLIDALLEETNEPHQLFRLCCSSYHSQSPLHPYLTNLMSEAGVFFDDDDQTRYFKLKKLILVKYKFDENFLHTIASLVSLQGEGNTKYSDTSPQHQLQLAQQSLIDFIIKLSSYQPVLLIVEDTHWIDPTTMRVIDLLVHKSHNYSIMLLLSYRLNKPLHYAQPHVTNLPLNKLTRQQSQQLIAEISKDVNLDESITHSISDKSAGIPLFIEEVTKAMLDRHNYSNNLSGSHSSIRVPDTLQASLLSILDGLGEAKYLIQCAAVIGNSFEKQLLQNICEQPNETVVLGLENLVRQNIIYCQSGDSYAEFQFRHVLLRDAVYESLLKKARRKIHAMIASYLSNANKFASVSSKQVIAYHYEQAEDYINGFNHWLDAGVLAFNSGATIEAVELLNNAATDLPKIDQRANLSQIYRLYMIRGRALNAALGAVSDEAHVAFRNAVSIARQIGDIEKEIDALDWEFGITFNAGMIRKSLRPAQTILNIGIDNDYLAARISGHQVLGMAHCVLGEFAKAQQHLEAALDIKGQEITGLNCYPSMTLDYLSYVKFFIGDKKSAQSLCRQAIESARQESDYATASALSNSCFTCMLLGDMTTVRTYSAEVIELARERGQYMFLNRGLFFQNLALASINQDSRMLEQVVQATNALFESKEEIDLTCLLGMTAEIQISLGDYPAAQESLQRALILSEQNEELFYQAELYRLKAELIVRDHAHKTNHKSRDHKSRDHKSRLHEAKSCLDNALKIASRQQAHGWIDKIKHTLKTIQS